MNALITGCCGFIGSHLVDELLSQGWEVHGLDLRTDAASAWDYVHDLLGDRLQRGTVLDWHTIWHILSDLKNRFDVVFHLAAQSHVDVSLDDVGQTMMTNAVGTHMVAEACARAAVPMVYCSTDEVYGDHQIARVESDCLDPSSPYSAGKAAGELAIRAAARSFGLRAVVTRGCNAYGSRQTPEKLIPIACRLLQRGDPVPLHGGGDQVRQWVAVEEFARCLRLAAERVCVFERGSLVETFNIAGPSRLSVRALVEALAAEAGVPADRAWRSVDDRPGQDRAYHVSWRHAYALLRFRAARKIGDELADLLAAYPAEGEVKLARYG